MSARAFLPTPLVSSEVETRWLGAGDRVSTSLDTSGGRGAGE